MRYLNMVIAVFIALLVCPTAILAQCNGWTLSPVNIKSSDCIANGSFSIQLSGNDLLNLSNIQYGIPLTQGGFSVQPNTSPDFANIPAGTFTVKVEATCNGNLVSKTTTVTIGGTYVAPSLLAVQHRASLNCGSYGQIETNMSGSAFPYTLKILSAPGAYSGPVSFTSSAKYTLLDKLPAGTYSLQAVDSCGTATSPLSVTVNSISPSSLSFSLGGYGPDGTGCNKLKMIKPWINMSTNPDLKGYFQADSLFAVAVSIDGGTTVTPFQKIDHIPFLITLPAGKTIKHLGGTNFIYYLKPPCGPVFQLTGSFSQVNMALQQIPKCPTGFQEEITLMGLMCYPVTVNLKNTATNVNYGPYNYPGGPWTSGVLPYGSYTLTYTTADGYTASTTITGSAPSANPYTVNHLTEATGLDGYISSFNFYRSGGMFPKGTVIKLISGPSGYAYIDTLWGSQNTYVVMHNHAPPTATNRYFIPGTYVWQIKDDCGSYTLTAQVQQSSVYDYTLDISNRVQTCNGLKVYPSGSFTKGQTSSYATAFKILKGPPGYNNAAIPAGGSFTLSISGIYVIGVSAYAEVYGYDLNFPNPYQVTDTIIYNHTPLTVDVNNTQGFLCIGASAGQGQIGIKGAGGWPYKLPVPHYKYYLAAKGNGVSGPYLGSNTTGYFAGMGMNAGDIYDLKIEDSCGAFVTHQVKILDLSTTQLASADNGTICEGDTLKLYALPLPGASYAWTGPNNFSSNQRQPMLPFATTAAAGQYTVTITTVYCSTPASATVPIIVHPAPGKAAITVNCIDTTAILTASVVAGADYQWYKDANTLPGSTGQVFTVLQPGAYNVRTIFPQTGCYTASDTSIFTTKPGLLDTAQILGDRDFLCRNDSVLLTAQTKFAAVSYQWYKNGLAIAGATKMGFYVTDPGSYTVETSSGPCSHPVSLAYALQERIPAAKLNIFGDTVLCEGQQVILTGNTGQGLTYTWKRDGNAIPSYGHTLPVLKSGMYLLEVSNGYCSEVTREVKIVVNARPIAAISPAGDIYLCEGDRLVLETPADADHYYTWKKDGTVLSGETGNRYQPSLPGRYTVVVGNGKCPDDSASVDLYIVPYPKAEVSVNGPTEFCEGLNTILETTAQPECVYQWYKNGQQIADANNVSYVVATSGQYRVDVSRKACTTASDDVRITVHAAPKPKITRLDQTLTTGVYPGYQWYIDGYPIAGETKQQHSLIETGHFNIKVTDSNGCEGLSDTLRVVSIEEGCIVRLPTAFTPNGDGRNDVFRLIGMPEYELLDWRVVNRWGQIVYNSLEGQQGWDGTLSGTPQETGSYFYVVRYRCNNEMQPRIRKGEVSLIR